MGPYNQSVPRNEAGIQNRLAMSIRERLQRVQGAF